MKVATMCPTCGAAHAPGDAVCSACGLVFASRAAALCPTCGHLQRLGAKRCQACGLRLAATSRRLAPGQTLDRGRFVVQRLLAHGGMGRLYLASDKHAFGRRVVIKALSDTLVASRSAQDARARLGAEARRLAALRHPAIPRIVSYHWEAGQAYLVMEYIEGHDLLQALTRADDQTGASIPGQPYDVADVLRWGIAVCETLEYLAARRPHPLVHGDVKPANLMLDCESQAIYLVDFGAAAERAPIAAGGAQRPADLFGTPGYAPPEQYRGEFESTSDVYSLAATLYHLATDDDPGLHPFDFPQLAWLGELGEALRMALQPRPEQRPDATTFRRHLMVLLGAGDPLVLLAPDGTIIADELGMTVWCERHWSAATSWLYGSLPRQVARWHGPALADQLQAVAQQHADRAAGLDAVLALLDPQGFGAARPCVKASTRLIELAPQAPGGTPLTLINGGRRYVQAKLASSSRLAASHAELRLAPGQHTVITLNADTRLIAKPAQVRSALLVETDTATLLRVEVRGSAHCHARMTRRLLRIGTYCFLMSILILLVIGLWRYWPNQ
jgi:hypothetical protein